MDELYGLHSTAENCSDGALMSPENLIIPADYQSLLAARAFRDLIGSEEFLSAASAISEAASITPETSREEELSSVIKAKIASHPCYPRLLEAYVDCQKVGAPPEMACLLDQIQRENSVYQRNGAVIATCLDSDPELDQFMVTYRDILVKYKSDLERPFNEATTFLNNIKTQLSNLCTGASIRSLSEDGALSSDEDFSGGEREMQEAQPGIDLQDLKDRLISRFGSHISTLKLEFSKKKKKGKLPREARLTLLNWWDVHSKWPYPTEGDKIALSESTGLDQKQINNWFINQRKRHWKPSESMQFALVGSLSGQFFTDE